MPCFVLVNQHNPDGGTKVEQFSILQKSFFQNNIVKKKT